ncbi:hypothetical protein AB205_0007020 [Aquarana catesbeiana]|uniref:Uncharacterized protein n=1 Tax=Aquarana catesbeiana TaxID=8400 RepID=A0A2G9RD22_AQUCT|nr:hypothetical protein AB205_0007020 [Aquarana catesbeiana]
MVFIKQVISKRNINSAKPTQQTHYKQQYIQVNGDTGIVNKPGQGHTQGGQQMGKDGKPAGQGEDGWDRIGSEQSRTETDSQSGYRQQGQGAGRKIPRQAYEDLPGIYKAVVIDLMSQLSAVCAVCSTLSECTRWWTPVLRPRDARVPPAGETSYCRSQVLEDTRWWTLVLRSKRPIAPPTGKPSYDI